jgi:DNA-binding protein YbaB
MDMDLSGMRARAEGMMADFQRLTSHAAEIRSRLLAVRSKATSDDGYVTAVVDPRGRLESLEIDPRVFRRPDSRLLADTILDTVRQAAEDADRQVAEAFEGYTATDIRARLDLDLEKVFATIAKEFDLPAKEEQE